MLKFMCVLLLAQVDRMLQVVWHTFEILWCNVSVATAHGTWDGMLNLNLSALVKGTGKQERLFPPFLSAVLLIYTTRHALPYLKNKTIHMRPHFWESLDTYSWAGIAQSL